MRRPLLAGLALALPGLMLKPAPQARAQAYDRLAPKAASPAAPPQAPTLPTPPPPALPRATGVVIPTLKALVFLPTPEALRASGLPAGTAGVQCAGLPLLAQSGFSRTMRAYLGKSLRLADLNTIARTTSAFYRTHGHPFVYVTIPPQNISTGVVQVIVTEYRLGTMTISGNRWFSTGLLQRESGLKPGEALVLSHVQAGLDRLNANPFRTVNAVFSPGQTRGTTDVTLHANDRLPVHVYGSFDTVGAPALGRGELAIGGTWGNVAGIGHIVSYQFTHSINDRYSGHAISWLAPLPWHDRIQVFGSYTREIPTIQDSSAYLHDTGHSAQASMRYIHDLPSITFSPDLHLSEDIQLGFDFKTTNNTLEFGGLSVFKNRAEVDQFPIIYNATLDDPYGKTIFQNQLVLSPGGLSGANHKLNFQTLVPGSSDRYVYDTLSLSRTTDLPAGFSWAMQAVGQLANTNLMYNDQLGLGGLSTARGYFSDSALGSEGVSITNELYGPSFSIMQFLMPGRAVQDTEQLGVFYDYGHTAQVHAMPNANNEADLASIGLDLQSSVGRYVNLVFNMGWRLRTLAISREESGYGNKGAYGNMALTIGF